MAEKKIIEIEVKTQQAVQSMDALSKSTKEAGKEFDKAATFAERYGEELQPLTTRMGEAEDRLYELANAGQTTTQEYKDLLNTVGEFRKVQINTDMAVDAAATTMGQKLGGALGGVTAGFSVAQGAFAAFGGESEEIEKALLKVQAAMAIQQGVQGIREAIPSFKALGAAIKSTTVSQGIYNFVMGISNKETLTNVEITEEDTVAKVGLGTATVGVATATTGASTAMKVLRAALISTGIGILIVGVGALIQNFDYLKEKFNGLGTGAKVLLSMIMPVVGVFWALSEAYDYFTADSIKANAKAESAIKKNTAALNTQIKANEKASTALKTKNGHEYKMAEASGASANALHKLAIRHANEEIALERASKATAHNTYVKEKNTLAYYRSIDASDEVIEKQKKLTQAAMENSIKEGKDLAAALENKAQLIRDNDVRIAGEKHSRSEKSNERTTKTEKVHTEKTVKNQKAQAKELLNITKNVEDENIRLMDEGQAKEEAVVLLAYKRKKEEQDKQLKDKSLKQKDYDTLQKLNAEGQEADLLAIKEKYILQAELARKTDQEKKDAEFFRQENLLAELTDTAEQKLYDKYKLEQEAAEGNAELLLALKKKYDKEVEALENVELEKKRERTKKGIDMAMSALSILNDAFQMSAGKSEKDQRKAFKAQKAFNLASAVTNTYLAVASALALNPKDSLFPGQRFVEAGLAGAAGAVQIANIAKTKFEGGASADTSGGGGGGVTAPTMSAPQFNVVGQSGVNQLATLNQQPIQAYVVSGQVTSQQALDRNRLENATLGG
jgi:hypothetical protein